MVAGNRYHSLTTHDAATIERLRNAYHKEHDVFITEGRERRCMRVIAITPEGGGTVKFDLMDSGPRTVLDS